MGRPHLCMIFEVIGTTSAIAKVAMQDVQVALNAGYRVTVVAKQLDPSLRGDVEWLRLYVPPRLFFVQWATARSFIRSALGDRRFDVVHAHQPQAASLSDVFQCHFLTRVAYERKCLEERPTLRARCVRVQQQGVLHLEDYFYRNWNPRTWMLYNSELTRREFHRLYGAPPLERVMCYEFPPVNIATDEERRSAKVKLIGHVPAGPVVGYLGGLQERKGYRELIAAVADEPGAFLLMGGSYAAGFDVPALGGRFKSVGLVDDTATFYAACDVFAVPSWFEPLGLVAFEAAARGVPVIATPEVGALPHLLEYGTGVVWRRENPIGPILGELVGRRAEMNLNARRMAEDLSRAHYGERLLGVYDRVIGSRGREAASATGRAASAAAGGAG